jgi:tetratricopeptide (TPR) repeat protein
MQKNTLLGLILGIFAGFIFGFFIANQINKNAAIAISPTNQTVLPSDLSAPHSQPAVAVQTSQNGMLTQVNETLEKAKNEPNNFEAQIKAGDMHAQIQRFDKAIEYYEKAHQLKPDDYQTIVKMGNSYFDQKQFENAEKWYLQALEKNPNDANVRTDLGVSFVEREKPDLERATKEFNLSLQINPKHEPTIYNLGIAYFKKGNTQEAEKALQQLEEINPQSQLAVRLKEIINQK